MLFPVSNVTVAVTILSTIASLYLKPFNQPLAQSLRLHREMSVCKLHMSA